MKSKKGSSFLFRYDRLEELAWDFIADLFQKDEQENLIVFQTYFERSDLELPISKLKIKLRRLVFSKVDDNIHRHYGEKDPSLKKIIRNIKLAVREQKCGLRVCFQNGTLIVEEEKKKGKKPLMPPDFLQARLCARLGEQMQIPETLAHSIDILLHQDHYRKEYPVVSLARIIRESFVSLQKGQHEECVKPVAESNILIEEFDLILQESKHRIKDKVGSRYLRIGKMDRDELEIYFETASDIIKNNFIEPHSSLSQFDQMQQHVDDLDYDQFRNDYRPVLEYLVKLIRDDLVDTYRKRWV